MEKEVKCIQSLYRTIQKQKIFLKNHVYKIVNEDDKFYDVVDRNNNVVNFSKEDIFGFYVFDKYFKFFDN